MLPGGAWNPGPLTYESDALPIVLRGPALFSGSSWGGRGGGGMGATLK